MGRTLANRDPRRNMRALVLAGVAARLPHPVGPHQVGDEMSVLGVDPLVDRLMADGGAGSAHGQTSGDELWRPADSEAVVHIATDALVLEASVCAAGARTGLGPRLSLVGQIVARVDRRGVAPQLP